MLEYIRLKLVKEIQSDFIFTGYWDWNSDRWICGNRKAPVLSYIKKNWT